jgi:iron complex transport system substrate-binding protein
MPHLRIVGLIASATELIHALGLGDFQVGRSHECDFPEAVKSLPVCTHVNFDVNATSSQIDERVKTILSKTLSVYQVKPEMLEKLAPTHILTQVQCQVCAVSQADVEEAACQLIGSKPEIISLCPNSLADFFQDIKLLGEKLGAETAAANLERQIKERFARVTATIVEAKAADSHFQKRRVAVIEWIEPLMAAGNWLPELVTMAGAENVLGEAGAHSYHMNMEILSAKDPDVIIVSPCGFDIKRTMEEMPLLLQQEEFRRLRAVREGRLYVADGNEFFNRPGPRLAESLEMLGQLIYPEYFLKPNSQNWLNSYWIAVNSESP